MSSLAHLDMFCLHESMQPTVVWIALAREYLRHRASMQDCTGTAVSEFGFMLTRRHASKQLLGKGHFEDPDEADADL